MNTNVKEILCCPTCQKKLKFFGENKFICPSCKKEALQEGRLIDFSQMTYTLPLDLAKHIQILAENAGRIMKDITPGWRIKSVLERVMKMAQGSICLEIGGADGPMTPTLENLFDSVLTIDYSKTFLRRIEAKTKKTICLFGDAHFLPLEDQSIDMVVCSEVLEHSTIPTQLMTEIQRVLKKNGVAIVSVPNESTLCIHRKRRPNLLPPSDSHINFFTPETLTRLAYRTGLNLVDIQTIFRPNSSFMMRMRNMANFIRRGYHNSYILCTFKPMANPLIYWKSLYEKIKS